MSILTLILSLIIWGLIFWILWWALGAVGLAEPFHKVATVILVIAAVIIVIGLLTGSVSQFPILLGH